MAVGAAKSLWGVSQRGEPHFPSPLFTCLPLSSGSRPGDTPTAEVRRRCWALSGRRREPPRNSPVRWSRQRYRQWRCCWNYPARVNKRDCCEKSAPKQEELTGTKWRSVKVFQRLQSRKERACWFIIITGSFWQLPSCCSSSSSSRRPVPDPCTLGQSLVGATWVVVQSVCWMSTVQKEEEKTNNCTSSLCFQCI